jgi:putative oxygen-independent coproporphyrinogen III oxidase
MSATAGPLSLPPLALYIHLPWCVRKCPYCDFNSHQQPKEIPQDLYVNALMADLEQDLPRVWGRPVVSIFFGGGTPSLFSAAAIGAILDGVRARIRLRPDAEITLECNPGTAEFDRFEGYAAAGVNRISFGVQSFNDKILQRLGRIHSAAEASRAFAMARAAGISNINLDLMYALPGQDLAGALLDINTAIALGPEHISHYHLTLEPDTVFARFPPEDLPDEDAAWDMQEAAQAALQQAGYLNYEVSAYAKADQVSDRQCQHNKIYWCFGDYLGIGAGAHGKITDLNTGTITRIAKQKIPRLYQDAAGTAQSISELKVLTAAELPLEYMLNALRLQEGFTTQEFAARTGLQLETLPGLAKAIARGLLTHTAGIVRTTELGARFLNDTINLFSP